MSRKAKSGKISVDIFDLTGQRAYRTYVDEPSKGLRGADLENLPAPLALLQGQDLSEAKLDRALLAGSDLSFAKLVRAQMRGANLDKAICRSADFTDADLSPYSTNRASSLLGTDFTNAILKGARLKDAIYDDATVFPAGFSPAANGLIHISDLTED